jgi:hypothetical protein
MARSRFPPLDWDKFLDFLHEEVQPIELPPLRPRPLPVPQVVVPPMDRPLPVPEIVVPPTEPSEKARKNVKRREWYAEHKEEEKERHREYYREHQDEILEQQREAKKKKK